MMIHKPEILIVEDDPNIPGIKANEENPDS
jgi:hypothetical protein